MHTNSILLMMLYIYHIYLQIVEIALLQQETTLQVLPGPEQGPPMLEEGISESANPIASQ